MFHLKWKSDAAAHTDVYHAGPVNIWRDYLPASVLAAIRGRHTGDMIDIPVKPGDLVSSLNTSHLFEMKRSQFGSPFAKARVAVPEAGRFYPKGVLQGVTNVFAANIQPFRCVQLNNGHMTVDFNHPLAGKNLALSTMIGNIVPKHSERGGTSFSLLLLDVVGTRDDDTQVVLETIAQNALQRVRLTDRVARLPGQVAMLLPNTSESGARLLADELTDTWANGSGVDVRLSVSTFPCSGDGRNGYPWAALQGWKIPW